MEKQWYTLTIYEGHTFGYDAAARLAEEKLLAFVNQNNLGAEDFKVNYVHARADSCCIHVLYRAEHELDKPK